MKDVKSIKDKIYEGQKKFVTECCVTLKRRLSNQSTSKKIRIQKKFTSKTRMLRETRCSAPPARADMHFRKATQKIQICIAIVLKNKASFEVKYKVLNIFCNKTKVFIT